MGKYTFDHDELKGFLLVAAARGAALLALQLSSKLTEEATIEKDIDKMMDAIKEYSECKR